MKRLLLLLFLLLPVVAQAQCIPPAAPTGSLGCFPNVSNLAMTDYLYAWQPSFAPSEDRLLAISQLSTLMFTNPTFSGTATMPDGSVFKTGGGGATSSTTGIGLSGTVNDCVQIGAGNLLADSGAKCGTGSGGSINVSGGLTSTYGSCGTALTLPGALIGQTCVNTQTTTTYTVADSDNGNLIVLSNIGTVAVSLPQAGNSGVFLSGWRTTIKNISTGGVDIITPITSTIDGASVLVLKEGDTVTLVSNGSNYYTSQPPQSAVLNARQYGMVCNGTTNDTAALNAAISAANSAGGAIVQLPSGTCALGATVVMQTGVTLRGSGRFATTLKALSSLSAATDLIQTANFLALNGTSTNGGPYMWGIENLTIDGNNANRTGSATGRDLAIFGYDYMISDLYIQHCPGDCVYATWGNEAGGLVPVTAGGVTFSSNWNHVLVWGAGNNGITYNGPSDSRFANIESFLNVNYGALFQDNTTTGAEVVNTELMNFHSYGNGNAGVAVDGQIHFDNLQSESNQGQCHSEGICTPSPSGGPGLVLLATSTHGQLTGTHLYTWNNIGDGLDLNNASNGGTVGNNISDFQSYSNSAAGLGLEIGYGGPNTIITGFSIDHNTGDGVNACVAGSSGGALLTMVGGDITSNSSYGFKNCMQDIRIVGVHFLNNGNNGFDSTGAGTNALLTLSGDEFEGNTGTEIALGTLVAPNNIDAVVYTGSSQTCWSGTPGSASNVRIVCAGSGTNNSVFYTTGTLYNNGTSMTVP